MASAGKILITPKGEWSADTSYKMLDMVKHNKKIWIAREDVPENIEPSEAYSKYWFDALNYDLDKIVLSYPNKADNPNTTTLSRIRTKHENCPTSDTDYVIDTIYVDGTDGIFSKFQIARCEQNWVFIRSKPYNRDWAKWDEIAMGGGITFDYNPSGLDYIEHTFTVGHPDSVRFFANVIGSSDLFVKGINIVATTESSVTVRFFLNKASSDIVSLRIGYSY